MNKITTKQEPDSGESRSKSSLSRTRFGQIYDQEKTSSSVRFPFLSNIHWPISFNSWRIPNTAGALVAISILLLSAVTTALFLTKSPDDQRLLEIGKHQLNLGQYAFAVETLSKATALRPNDPNAFLALARAYVGIDQIEKAWDCIMHAQQLGIGVIAEPALASELANYYRQRGQYDKAINLLRPLANASIPGKKGELADLDALKGDQCIERGEFEQAQRAWEEVQELKEGSRYAEVQARLATIYSKLASVNYANHEDIKSLDYLNKLNSIGENARNYVMAADILERDGKLKEAIEQIQRAIKISGDDQFLKMRLAQLLARCGKELIGIGDGAVGYGYLQQANSIDPNIALPVVTLRDLSYKLDANGRPKLAGEVWNSSDNDINSLTMKVQLYDTGRDKVIWSTEQRIIDEYVSALASQQAKSFMFLAPSVKDRENLAFRVYLDGNLYESFPLKSNPAKAKNDIKTGITIDLPNVKKELVEPDKLNLSDEIVRKAPARDKPVEEPISPEEKTMKDLEY